mmetsp:Transcript_108162/g.312572  ORF Transcript_108162/g.312572 Transcript_108162/m.312572 type:complete len:347 (+) Transcript_108162:194-1234(+)
MPLRRGPRADSALPPTKPEESTDKFDTAKLRALESCGSSVEHVMLDIAEAPKPPPEAPPFSATCVIEPREGTAEPLETGGLPTSCCCICTETIGEPALYRAAPTPGEAEGSCSFHGFRCCDCCCCPRRPAALRPKASASTVATGASSWCNGSKPMENFPSFAQCLSNVKAFGSLSRSSSPLPSAMMGYRRSVPSRSRAFRSSGSLRSSSNFRRKAAEDWLKQISSCELSGAAVARGTGRTSGTLSGLTPRKAKLEIASFRPLPATRPKPTAAPAFGELRTGNGMDMLAPAAAMEPGRADIASPCKLRRNTFHRSVWRCISRVWMSFGTASFSGTNSAANNFFGNLR